MVKSEIIPVAVEPEFHEQLRRKSKEAAVSLSEIARRAWQVWLVTGEMPKLPKKMIRKEKRTD
jgi:hypothetical protein